jgi:predicted dehydrogenase
MSEKMLNLAWVGTAHIHTPGFSGEVLKRKHACAGVWDHNEERAKMNAEKLGGEVKTVEQMVADKSVDGFIVCSETVHHLSLVEKLVKASKPLFIEKPMGFNAEQSTAILSLLEENKVVFQTGYFSRGGAGVQTLKKKVEEGFFGQITRVRASNCHSGALGGWFDGEWRWMADRKQSGVGAYGDLGTHVLDLLIWMFGGVSAVTGLHGKGTARYEGCEETGEAILKFNSGVIGTLTAAWDDVTDPMRIMVSGTKGFATLGADLKLAGPDGKLEKVENLEPAVAAGFPAFLDYLEGKSVSLVSAREAAQRDVVMDSIYRAAESQTWVEICSDWH